MRAPRAEGHATRVPVPYDRALRLQEALVARRRRGEVADLLWLLEHPPTITLGTSGGNENVQLSRSGLAERGIELFETRRGGNVTCHEPGQLVGYAVVDWGRERDLHDYLRRLEEGLIGAIGRYGLSGERVEGRTGVWLAGPPRKIAAMGVRVQGWVTSHGFALNVTNSLETFEAIVPCGIADATVTSLGRELATGAVPAWGELCDAVHQELERALGRPLWLIRGDEAELRAARHPPGWS